MKHVDSSEILVKIIFGWYISVFIAISLFSLLSILIRPLTLLVETGFLIWAIYFFKKNSTFIININWEFILISLLLILTVIQGIFSAPNTTDSLTYHLPRVIHWLQNQSVYQTAILNDHDYMPPLGEYLDLFFYQITSNDELVFMSQWIAYLGCIVISGLIARSLGATRKIISQIRLSIALIPMAILQASSTQTDLVSSFLFLFVVYCSLKIYKCFNYKDFTYFLVGSCLGFLVKPTFAIFAIIPIGLVLLSLFRNEFKIYKYILIIIESVIIGTIFLSAFFFQNIRFYHSLLGQHLGLTGQLVFTNEQISFPIVLSNIIRNIMIQIPVPIFTDQIQSVIELIHKIIGVGINDPRSTWYGTSFRVLDVIFPQEDLVSNPLQLFAFVLALWITIKSLTKNHLQIYLFFSIVISFILFCTLLKWQPWNSRLHLPLISLMTIVSILVLKGHKLTLNLFRAVSLCLAILLIVFNVSRPLVSYPQLAMAKKYNSNLPLPQSIFLKPRVDQYFNSRPFWRDSYQQISQKIVSQKPNDIKIMTIDGFEYPLFVLLKNDGYLPRITNTSKNLFYTGKLISNNEIDNYCVMSGNDYQYACLVTLR